MRFGFLAVFVLLLLAACQSNPPTVVYIVVTPTPENGDTVVVQTTPGTAATSSPAGQPATATDRPASPIPQDPTNTPHPFPSQTPVVTQVQVAEQVFEHGRMMWLEPQDRIWVMFIDGEGEGRWLIYEDSFEEGDPELDANIDAPEGMIQPERGFGKLWRDNPDIRDELGWAITPEFGYISRYEYHGDEGYHVLFSLNQEAFRFNEGSSTWELN